MKTIIVEDGLSINLNRGVGIYTLSLISMLNDLGLNVEVPRKNFLDSIKNTVLRRILYILWLNIVFTFNLFKRNDVKIVLFPATITPFIKPRNITYISVMHDILHIVYPETRTFVQRMHDNFSFLTASKFADRIIAVSQTTKNELIKRKIVKNKYIDIVYNTHSISLLESSEKSLKILEMLNIAKQKYILSVATVHRHKNIQMLIDAFNVVSNKYPDIKLVLVGNNGNCKLNIENKNIILCGFVSNDNLKILYENALFYVFPSLYEGFGIPLIDAQYFKLPVVCSDITIFNEICEDSAEYTDISMIGFANSMQKLIEDASYRNLLISKGEINTQRFNKQNIKEQLHEVILNLDKN